MTKIKFIFNRSDGYTTYDRVLDLYIQETTSGALSITPDADQAGLYGKTRVTIWLTDQCTPDTDDLLMEGDYLMSIPWNAQSVTAIDWSGDEHLGTGDCPFELSFHLISVQTGEQPTF